MTSSTTSNVEVIERFHDAMEAADREVLVTMLDEIAHPDCEWTPLVANVEGGSYQGKEGTLKFFADFLDSFEVRYEDRDLRAISDEAVLMLCMLVLRGRGSGAPVSQEVGIVYEFEDGLLRRGRAYTSHAEARAVAEVAGA